MDSSDTTSDEHGFAPLAGVSVADFTTSLAGPYATMILAQLGADVIKVEPPSGDDVRAWTSQSGELGLVHVSANAGKRSIVLDLKQASGRGVAHRLIARSDVVLLSAQPGVAERLGISADQVRAVNPDALYYDVNAFGAGVSGRRLKGYDPLVQAFAGIMAMTGHDGTPPTRCAPSITDLGTGQWVAMGVVAALLSRERGRPVTRMETSLVDTAFALVPYQAADSRISRQPPPRAGSGNPIAAPYECFSARDGEILIAAPSQRLWERLTDALAAPDLRDDPRFREPQDRSRNRVALAQAINGELASADVDEWLARLDGHGVPAGRVQGLHEAVDGAIVDERRTFLPLDGVDLVRLPWLVDDVPIAWRRPAPGFGEHTHEVLTELGYDQDEREQLLREAAAFGPPEGTSR